MANDDEDFRADAEAHADLVDARSENLRARAEAAERKCLELRALCDEAATEWGRVSHAWSIRDGRSQRALEWRDRLRAAAKGDAS